MNSKQLEKLGNEQINDPEMEGLTSTELERLGNEQSEKNTPLVTYHAKDRRVYNGAPCSDVSREWKRTDDLEKRMRGADKTARCTYFPMEGKYLVFINSGLLENPDLVGPPRELTGNFHEDKQHALIEAIQILEQDMVETPKPTPQKEYEVYNKTSGQDMGVWEGATPQEAIEAMIAEGDPGALVASYEDWECLEVLVRPQDTSYPTRRDILIDTLVKEEVEDTSLFWDCLIDSLVGQGIDPEVWLNQHATLQIAELCREEIYSYLED